MTIPAKMKAQVFHEPEKMKLESRPVPQPASHEVLVRVHAVGICGSDVAYYYGKSSLETPNGKGPLVLGHEFSGEVVAMGKEAAEKGKFKPGDRVVVNPVQSNPEGKWSRRGLSNLDDDKRVLGVSVDGGLAEYCVSHYYWTVKVPESLSLDQAAATEPLACAVYAVNNLKVEPGQFVVVFGPGPIGLMMVQLAKARGAGKVMLVGTRDYRLERGKALGADVLANTDRPESPYYTRDLKQKVRAENEGELADRAITSTSALEAIHAALAITGKHSTIVVFGLPGDKDVIQVPALESILMDKTIRYSWLAPNTWPEAVDALARGKVKVDRILTHHFKLDGLAEAIRKVRAREDNCLKALIKVAEG